MESLGRLGSCLRLVLVGLLFIQAIHPAEGGVQPDDHGASPFCQRLQILAREDFFAAGEKGCLDNRAGAKAKVAPPGGISS